MGKHTKGPWNVEIDSVSGKKTQIKVGEQRIASLNFATDKGNVEANAALIAAAPELLGACKEALKALTGEGLNDGENAVSMLEGAIRKTEGR